MPSNWQVVGANENRPVRPAVLHEHQAPVQGRPAARARTTTTPSGSTARASRCRPSWKGRSVFVHFAGVQSAYYVWLNGQRLGYREDAFTPGEFDLTPHLRPGTNVLAVEVIHHSDGSYLEDQDYWRLAGIFRDVYLARPAAGAPARLHGAHRPRRRLPRRDARAARVAREPLGGGGRRATTWSASVLDADGRGGLLARGSRRRARSPPAARQRRRPRASCARPALWSAETPNLYTLVLEHRDAAGEVAGGRRARASASARSRSRAGSCC